MNASQRLRVFIAIALALIGSSACASRSEPDQPPSRYGLGHAANQDEIVVIAQSVLPDGEGLPAGRGTAARGAPLFAQRCAGCHGPAGEGTALGPKLIGRDPRIGFPFATDPNAVKTIGNYWPYATTVYDYVRRAMPLSAPGSLRPDEIYALTAFLLAKNEVIPDSMVIDAETLPAVRMPARDRFVLDDRRGGHVIR
ncbi:MAG TPA: cytochrome c [Gemmatimonadaceae bacterium]|nr:cytochrome c [Gemmatimonadaceae bacterium]